MNLMKIEITTDADDSAEETAPKKSGDLKNNNVCR
jgi:hypothetical protein